MNKNVNVPEYWDEKYSSGNDNWNLNTPTPVFVRLIKEQKFIRPGKLLIPGSGRGFDAVFAAGEGYEVTAADFSPEANTYARNLAEEKNVNLKFFEGDLSAPSSLPRGEFDYIFEYVTFCAVEKDNRYAILNTLADSLKPGGRLITLLFPVDGRPGGPPFAIDVNEFYSEAKKYFTLLFMDKLVPSVKPRKGNEILFIFTKK